MKSHEPYVAQKSNYFIYSPSITATQTFFYPICTGHFIYEPGYQLYRNAYDSFLLIAVHDGELVVEYDGTRSSAKSGDFIFINCYNPHGYITSVGCECTWIHFDGPMAAHYYDLIHESHPSVLTLSDSYTVLKRVTRIYQAFLKKEKIREPLMSKWLSDILTSILLNHPQVQSIPQQSRIEDIVVYIHEHFNHSLSIEHLAGQALISPYHFIRLFKKETGYTPHEYILDIRINTAKYLLKTSTLSVKSIAFDIGFSSESSFCTSFKKKVGLTPSKYRKTDISNNFID